MMFLRGTSISNETFKYSILRVEGQTIIDLLNFRIIVRNGYAHLHEDVDKNMKVIMANLIFQFLVFKSYCTHEELNVSA